MRNFDERKAEIFRRSENRIKERKRNRNRILALCVPLCLCIAILSVIYLPDMMISPDKSNTAGDMNMAGGVENSSGFVYTSFEITSTKTAKSDTDKQNIENIYNIIQSAFTVNDYSDDVEQETTTDRSEFPQEQKPSTQKGESTLKGEDNYSTGLVESFSKGVAYTLTFTADNGQKIVYTLCDNILTNETTNESVTVTEDQLKDLYTKVFTVTYGKE